MIQQQSNVTSVFESEPNAFAADPSFAYQRLDTTGAELVPSSPRLIHLNFEELSCFEVVERQFETWGVVFKNAIAIKPSNPAFPPKSGQTVLMGSPRAGVLEASFNRPAQFVSAFLTSSRRTAMTAFDENDTPIAETEIPAANLADSGSSCEPNIQLNLKASNICRVCVRSCGGQFTVDDFAFGF